mmetsp:Transcript_47616/g.87507  ORF Transcript_47616/g.87507 Transcript_47616/m.87507 type:complete len:230 (-) Transcript_47616:16-705(-)
MHDSASAERTRLLEAVKKNWGALRLAAEDFRRDREIVLAAVQKYGRALQFAADSCKCDHEIVLAAVTRTGSALQYAAADARADREIVLSAVKQDGLALEFAAQEHRSDCEIVLAAVESNVNAFDYAAEALLLDNSFAAHVKQRCFICKVHMLSGRHTYVVHDTESPLSAYDLLVFCCDYLGIEETGTEALVYGAEVVPREADVRDWPGIRPPGEVSEYELLVGVAEPRV